MQGLQRYVMLLLLLLSHTLTAQRVLYSPTVDNRQLLRFTVAGKTGDYYWVHKEKRKKHVSQRAEEWMKEEQSFDVYDARLQLINSIPAAALTASTLKKYLLCGNHYFDELILQANLQQTVARLRRYSATGDVLADSIICSFPFAEPGYRFLLSTSADKSKTLLLGFESVPSSAPKMHAVIFSENWKMLSSLVFDYPFITQPFIQDDFFCFPSAVNNAPVQLANNGQWLMAAPSRMSNNFLLLHFDGRTNNIAYKEIILPPLYKMEDIALSVNNAKGEAFAGILSNYRQSVHKDVHVTHYSFSGQLFDFDSSYRFSTLGGNQSANNNLVRESFTAVPDMGFMLLKEYGRTFTGWYRGGNYDPPWDAGYLFASNNTSSTSSNYPINNNGYSRIGNATGFAGNYSRGDLSVFYFPGRAADSSWSGFINKKQVTELNAPTLSYLFVPLQDKLIFLYNSADRENDLYGSTLVLDPQGNLVTEKEVISWKSDQSLRWQQSQQITPTEVAVPYSRNQQQGFAVFRF